MKKTKILIAIIVITVILILGFSVGSFSVNYGGLFHIGGRYYKTPTKAFNADYFPVANEEKIEIANAIDTVIIDEENCLFLATTKNGYLLVAPMTVNKNKYSYYGEYYLYDKNNDNYDSQSGLITNKTPLYASNGVVSHEYEWCILFDDYPDKLLIDAVKTKEYSPTEFTNFKLVLF